MSEMPSSFYYVVGLLVVANIGTLVTVIIGGLRFTWYISRLIARLETVCERNVKDINNAHEKIRQLEGH